MSIDLMTRAWRTDLPGGSDKLVLLALADFANGSSGEAWPSNETLAAKCSRSEQTVRDALHRLAAKGHVTRIDRPGRTSMFRVHPVPATPHGFHQGSENYEGSENYHPHPSQDSGGTPPNIDRQPLPISGPKPLGTVTEPSVEPSYPRPAERGYEIPDWMPADAWRGFIEMRRKKRKPPTDYAVSRLIAKLGTLMAEGHEPGAVLDQSTLNGWTDLYPLKELKNGSKPRSPGHEATSGIPTANPFIRAIASRRAARGV